jgi:glycosyltransferase involved in cell wall biosynthesis
MKLSVVIPLYNEQRFIAECLRNLLTAIDNSPFETQIIVVNDGSTDDSLAQVASVADARIEVFTQENKGRYLARKAGVERCEAEQVLFVDPKVMVKPQALAFLATRISDDSDQVWNGDVDMVVAGNPFAMFWKTITCIGWHRYFRHRVEVSFGPADFDRYPKGTGFLLCPKQVLLKAFARFEAENGDGQFVSDDTALLRIINEDHLIHLAPEFGSVYYSRNTAKQFVTQAFRRGQTFIASYFFPKNIFFIPLLAFFALCLAVVLGLVLAWKPTLIALLVAAVAGIALLGIAALAIRVVRPREALAFAALALPFAILFGAGLWRGLARKLIR